MCLCITRQAHALQLVRCQHTQQFQSVASCLQSLIGLRARNGSFQFVFLSQDACAPPGASVCSGPQHVDVATSCPRIRIRAARPHEADPSPHGTTAGVHANGGRNSLGCFVPWLLWHHVADLSWSDRPVGLGTISDHVPSTHATSSPDEPLRPQTLQIHAWPMRHGLRLGLG
jgi:hypothetical protein